MVFRLIFLYNIVNFIIRFNTKKVIKKLFKIRHITHRPREVDVTMDILDHLIFKNRELSGTLSRILFIHLFKRKKYKITTDLIKRYIHKKSLFIIDLSNGLNDVFIRHDIKLQTYHINNKLYIIDRN